MIMVLLHSSLMQENAVDGLEQLVDGWCSIRETKREVVEEASAGFGLCADRFNKELLS